jgi:hypothetical protein
VCQKLIIDLFWERAMPLALLTVNAQGNFGPIAGGKKSAQEIRSCWDSCGDYLNDILPPISREMQYASAAWVDEMLISSGSSVAAAWKSAPLQLFWNNDLEAGVRYFELQKTTSATELLVLKSWWFSLWLGLGFSGGRSSELISHGPKIREHTCKREKSKLTSGVSVLSEFFLSHSKSFIVCVLAWMIALSCYLFL